MTEKIDKEKEDLEFEVNGLRKEIANKEINNEVNGKIGRLVILIGWNFIFFGIIFTLDRVIDAWAKGVDGVSYLNYFCLKMFICILFAYAVIRVGLNLCVIFNNEMNAFGQWAKDSVIKARDTRMEEIKEYYAKERKKKKEGGIVTSEIELENEKLKSELAKMKQNIAERERTNYILEKLSALMWLIAGNSIYFGAINLMRYISSNRGGKRESLAMILPTIL